MDFVNYHATTFSENLRLGHAMSELSAKTPSSNGGRSDAPQQPKFSTAKGPGDGHKEIEISTRPRLTRDQVDLLEGQFQAYHKPNTHIKRQLAEQTGLSMPRVAVCGNMRLLGGPLQVLTCILLELVPESTRKGEAAEKTAGVRDFAVAGI